MIYLRGNRSQGLRILGIDVVETAKEPAYSGTIVDLPPQGAGTSELMAVDLDQVQPVIRAASLTGGELTIDAPYFTVKTIELKDKEEIVLVLRATTERNTISFRLKADYQVGDSRESVDIDNNGQPFKMTAYSCAAGYKSAYGEGTGVDGTFAIVPVDPRGYKPLLSNC
jgi:hypothetical protein